MCWLSLGKNLLCMYKNLIYSYYLILERFGCLIDLYHWIFFPPSCTQMLFLRCFEKQKFSEYISSSFLGGWVRVDTSSLWSHQVMHSNKHILSPFESGLHLLIPLLFGFVLIVCVHVCCNRNRDLRYISKNTYIKKKKCLLSCFSSFFFLFSLFFFPKDFETIYPLERENKEKINFRAEKEPNT